MHELDANDKSRSSFHVRLSTIFLLVTACSISLAWLADLQKLRSQIEHYESIQNPPVRETLIYRLNNIAPQPLVRKLNQLFSGQRFYDATTTKAIGFTPNPNSLIVNTDASKRAQIELLIEHLDSDETTRSTTSELPRQWR
jgi:hypothetical protein